MRTILEPQVVAESSLRISVSVKLMEEVLKTISPERIPTGVILKRSKLGPEGASSNQRAPRKIPNLASSRNVRNIAATGLTLSRWGGMGNFSRCPKVDSANY